MHPTPQSHIKQSKQGSRSLIGWSGPSILALSAQIAPSVKQERCAAILTATMAAANLSRIMTFSTGRGRRASALSQLRAPAARLPGAWRPGWHTGHRGDARARPATIASGGSAVAAARLPGFHPISPRRRRSCCRGPARGPAGATARPWPAPASPGPCPCGPCRRGCPCE